ncbi:sensor histidine kinase [Paenibacillus oryzisoli]|uniref:sensor histidine kinase n=1 Tax=Paenibacillus oryzisoli TaxID=1850517 RepID=UPI003D28FCC7
MKMKSFVILAFWIVILSSSLQPFTAAAESSAQPREGVLDITGYGAENQRIVPLHGEWEFYWQQLLAPVDFAKGGLRPAYITVPSSWTAASLSGMDSSGRGYGTYRLLLQVPESDLGQSKALFLRAIGSAYRLWIDGEEKPGLGQVGTSLTEEQPKSHVNLVFFQPRHMTMEIVIQVSNYSFREGGINRDIVYGDTDALIPGILKEMLYDIFVIGGFLMIGVYHLVMCGMRKRDHPSLFVGLVAIAVAMRTMFINGYLSTELLHIESWEWLTRLEYLSEIAAFITLVFLMKSLYPHEVHKRMLQLAVIVAALLFLFICLTPARIYTESMLLQTIIKAVFLLYFIIYVGIKAYLRKREGALIHMAALLLIGCALVNDTLYYLRMADTVELLDYSIVPFMMAQAVIVSHRYVRLSRRNDALVEELGEANRLLERKVDDRTRSLHEANERRRKMLANIAHDLGTPLVAVQTCLHLMARGKLTADNPTMTAQLLDKTSYVKRLVDDLFELSKLESRNMAFQLEQVEVWAWMEELYIRFEADLNGEGMILRKKITGADSEAAPFFVRIDRFRMLQVIQNLLANAVKFSKGISDAVELRGKIQPDANGTGSEFVFEVADSGKGLSEAEQTQVFNRFYTNRDHNESGSGLGLAIVQEIVEQHQGRVGVRSESEAGSVFYFILPAYRERIN